MGISHSSLELIKYIQEKQNINIKNISSFFNKTESSIRREIDIINLYSGNKDIILIKNGLVTTSLNYIEYTDFIQSLSMDEYFSNRDERILIILISALLNDYVNLTDLYNHLGLSITTKKNDTRYLKSILNQNNLTLTILKKKGIKITGNETVFRLFVIQKLQAIIDIDLNNNFKNRKANTPFETYAFNIFNEKISTQSLIIKDKLLTYINNKDVNLSYHSRKFLILYLSVVIFRQNEGYILTKSTTIPLNISECQLFDNVHENKEFSNIDAILDTNPSQDFLFDEKLWDISVLFVDTLLLNMNKTIVSKVDFVQEIYRFMYKKICSQWLNIYFDDKLVNNVELNLPDIHKLISNNQKIFTDVYNVNLNNIQISTLALITKKWLDINDSVQRKSLKIILLTNIVYERVQYFEELLKSYYDVTLVGVFTLYDIEKIKNIEYDFILLFSNRMLFSLNNTFKNVIKVNFFLNNDDIKLLNSYGFKPSKKRILTSEFIKNIDNKSKEELVDYIKSNYNDYFL